MFKRSEKKIKAVFKMQFQATQVPLLKAKGLMISLVPVGVGKPTVRLAKAPIIQGTCTWETPVYETVKLVKETKTGRIRENFYYVVVSTGSSKSGFLGEVSIDFADLAEATKPMNFTLPLQTSKSGAILHVTVQNMQGGPDSRYDEDSETPVDESYDPNFETEEKDSHGLGTRNPKSPQSDDLSEVTSPHNVRNGRLEDAESDYNDAESRRDGVRGTSNIGRLANQLKVVERKAELSELQVQSLRKQITKETRRGQQLSEQIVCLKEERDTLKAECDQLKFSLICKNEKTAVSNHTPKETENLSVALEKIEQELQHEKHMNKKLRSQLQKSEDSNSEFVLAMRDLSKKLEHKNTEISRLYSEIKAFHKGSEARAVSPRTKMDQSEESNVDDAKMLKQKIENLYCKIETHEKEKTEIQMALERLTMGYDSLEAENKGICSKFEQNETEKMELQYNYTESLAREKKLKLQIATLEAENRRQALQYSDSLKMIDEQVEGQQKELEKQAQDFEEDLEAVSELKVEMEQRAIRAEDTLRKTRWSNANAAERLQEEFKQISTEMSLKIEENEKLAGKAVAEANDLHLKNEALEGLLKIVKEELQTERNKYEIILQENSEKNERIDGSNKNSEMVDQKKISRDESEQKKTIQESETLQRWKTQKKELERQLASAMKESEKLMHENLSMKSQIDQKKTKEENLHLVVKKLRLKNNEVKSHLLELELEKEGLKKEISKLHSDLHKKGQEGKGATIQDSVTSAKKEKNLNSINKEAESNLEKNHIRAVFKEELEQENMVAKDKGEEVRVSEDIPAQKSGQSGGRCDNSSLLNEVALLKERNKSMEEELKEMHERYSEISLKFAEVEGERQQLVMALRNIKSGKKN